MSEKKELTLIDHPKPTPHDEVYDQYRIHTQRVEEYLEELIKQEQAKQKWTMKEVGEKFFKGGWVPKEVVPFFKGWLAGYQLRGKEFLGEDKE